MDTKKAELKSEKKAGFEEMVKDEKILIEKRPHFSDNQIMSLSELKPGKKYMRRGGTIDGMIFKLLSVPHLSKNNDLTIETFTETNFGGYNHTQFLTDLGVCPYRGYPDGKYRWHFSHWLEEVSE